MSPEDLLAIVEGKRMPFITHNKKRVLGPNGKPINNPNPHSMAQPLTPDQQAIYQPPPHQQQQQQPPPHAQPNFQQHPQSYGARPPYAQV